MPDDLSHVSSFISRLDIMAERSTDAISATAAPDGSSEIPLSAQPAAPLSSPVSSARQCAPPGHPSTLPFPAVIDIEDLRHVTICGVRRPRPPIVPYLCPFRVHLEVGKTYRFCTCGRSKSQPFCDDEHTDDDPQPLSFSIDHPQSFHSLCACKYSLSMPFCDGSALSPNSECFLPAAV